MAKENSFDIVSKTDYAEVNNALNQTMKEISQRFDFKGSRATVELQDKDLVILGSGELIRSLMPYGLIDEFRIAVNPVVLGGGTPLFKQGERVKLKLLDSKAHSTGIVILRYQPAK